MNEITLLGKKILVVEDNAINQMLVKHTLAKSGAELKIAGTGTEALEILKENSFHLILMDIQMPELDGYQTTQVIRKEMQLNVPILAMTALALHGEEDRCLNAGMDGYMSKPFTLDIFYKTLNRVLNQGKVENTNNNVIGDEEVFLDLNTLYQLSGNDLAYRETLINTFINNINKNVTRLETFTREKDWNHIHQTAQLAKSTLSIIQSRQIGEILQKIEWSATTNAERQNVEDLVQQLIIKTEKAKLLLREKFGIIQAEAMVA